MRESDSLPPPERIFKRQPSAMPGFVWYLFGGLGVFAGVVGFVLSQFIDRNLFTMHLMSTFPCIVAFFCFAYGWSVTQTPLAVGVGPASVRIKTQKQRRTYSWDEIRWCRVQEGGLDQGRLIIYDTSGKEIASISKLFRDFDELAELVSSYVGTKTDKTADRIQLSKARRAAVFSAILGLFGLASAPFLAWYTYDEQRAERLLQEAAVPGEATVEELFLAPNGVTPRLVYRITTPDGKTATRNAQLRRSLWDAFQGIKTVPVVYVPDEPEISRLQFGEDEDRRAFHSPWIGYLASGFFGVMAIGALAMTLIFWRGLTLAFDKEKGWFAFKPYGAAK